MVTKSRVFVVNSGQKVMEKKPLKQWFPTELWPRPGLILCVKVLRCSKEWYGRIRLVRSSALDAWRRSSQDAFVGSRPKSISCVSHCILNPISHPAGNWCDLLCPFPLARSPETGIRLAVLTVSVAFWAERSSDEKVFRQFAEQHYGAGGYVCRHPSRQVSSGIVTTVLKGTEPPYPRASALPFASNISQTKRTAI